MEVADEILDFMINDNIHLAEILFCKLLKAKKYKLAIELHKRGNLEGIYQGCRVKLCNDEDEREYGVGYIDWFDWSDTFISIGYLVNKGMYEELSYFLNNRLMHLSYASLKSYRFINADDISPLRFIKVMYNLLYLDPDIQEEIEDRLKKYILYFCFVELCLCLHSEEPLFDENVLIHEIRDYFI